MRTDKMRKGRLRETIRSLMTTVPAEKDQGDNLLTEVARGGQTLASLKVVHTDLLTEWVGSKRDKGAKKENSEIFVRTTGRIKMQ